MLAKNASLKGVSSSCTQVNLQRKEERQYQSLTIQTLVKPSYYNLSRGTRTNLPRPPLNFRCYSCCGWWWFAKLRIPNNPNTRWLVVWTCFLTSKFLRTEEWDALLGVHRILWWYRRRCSCRRYCSRICRRQSSSIHGVHTYCTHPVICRWALRKSRTQASKTQDSMTKDFNPLGFPISTRRALMSQLWINSSSRLSRFPISEGEKIPWQRDRFNFFKLQSWPIEPEHIPLQLTSL